MSPREINVFLKWLQGTKFSGILLKDEGEKWYVYTQHCEIYTYKLADIL